MGLLLIYLHSPLYIINNIVIARIYRDLDIALTLFQTYRLLLKQMTHFYISLEQLALIR